MGKEAENLIARAIRTVGGKPAGRVVDFARTTGQAIDKAVGHSLPGKALGKAVEYSPEIAAVYGGKKAWESNPAKKARYRYAVWKQKRKLRKAGYRV